MANMQDIIIMEVPIITGQPASCHHVPMHEGMKLCNGIVILVPVLKRIVITFFTHPGIL